ncbi:hypothetical protein CG724_12750 [Streptomyces sp. CB02120-2]|nr:hypothetical protein CG724_12750 [Streptomyces sp. CB02120-2]
MVDRHGTPLVVSLTSGNRHDVTQLLSLLDFIPRLRGLGGRLRHRPRRLFADRCYDFDKYRRVLRARGITPKIARHGTLHGSGLGKTRWVAVTNRAHGPAATRPALGYLGGAGAERAPAFGSVRSSGSDKRGALSGLRLIAVGRVDQQRRHVQGDVLELFRRVGASVPAGDHADRGARGARRSWDHAAGLPLLRAHHPVAIPTGRRPVLPPLLRQDQASRLLALR